MKLSENQCLSEAKPLYYHAFPKEERLPWWVLRLMTIHKDVKLTSYNDGGSFIGFTHTTAAKDILFVMFFAVNEGLRGMGYGSAILAHLKMRHPDKTILLNVEPLDADATNAQERILRMEFYKKNGFYDTGYQIAEVGGIFQVLSTKSELDIPSYLKVFRKLSLGFWRPDITKAE